MDLGWQRSARFWKAGEGGLAEAESRTLAWSGSGSLGSVLLPIEPKDLPALCSALPARSLSLPCVLASPEIHPQICQSPEIIPQHPPDKSRKGKGGLQRLGSGRS